MASTGTDLRSGRQPHLRATCGCIDDAFARWDWAHLQQFHLADGCRVGNPELADEIDDDVFDRRLLTLGRLKPGERFVYEFDFGDNWLHLCTVAARRIDPAQQLGIVPDLPLR